MVEDTKNVHGNSNTNYAADELRAGATSPPLALCPQSTGFAARGAVAGPLGRVPTHREALHLWARTPWTNPKGQTVRGRAKAGGPGLTCPRTVLNSSVTSAYAAHCSHLSPIWVAILETRGAWTGCLWGGTHRVTSGHRRRSVGLGDWAGPGSRPGGARVRVSLPSLQSLWGTAEVVQ